MLTPYEREVRKAFGGGGDGSSEHDKILAELVKIREELQKQAESDGTANEGNNDEVLVTSFKHLHVQKYYIHCFDK